jgi:ATP-dependent DNA helicase RecG
MITASQLDGWLMEPEGLRLEFKSASTSFQFEKLVDYCVALANEGGGKIILGVTDKRPRSVIGTTAFAEPGRTEAGLYERLHHRIPLQELDYHGRRVLVAQVPGRLPSTAWEYNGRYLRRAGDDLVSIPPAELQAMFSEVVSDYSAEPCPAKISDLESSALGDFRRRWARKASNPRIEQWDDWETLTNAELLVDRAVTIAALVLFGGQAALTRYLSQAEVIFEYRSSEASGPAQDRYELRSCLLHTLDELWRRINLRNDRQSYQEGLFRYEIPTFDETAVREALLNAVAHRDYRAGGSVFVRQYFRRLEIVSPGGFPPGITAENILDQQSPRNRRLAEALSKCGLIERSGQGINLMVETAIRQSKPLPGFSGTSPHEVRLTLSGNIQDEAFIRFLRSLGEDVLRNFSTYDFLVLDCLRRDAQLDENLKARLPSLVEFGAVECIGRGRGVRYILSRGLYSALGNKGTYTRKRGLDHETNKSLLEKHLLDNPMGAQLSELRQVLPAVSERSVQHMLAELKEEGRAALKGARRWARWFPTVTSGESAGKTLNAIAAAEQLKDSGLKIRKRLI